MRLAKDLKPVADAPHKAAAIRELDHRLHQRRKTRDSARTQVVPVRESAGQNDAVGASKIVVFVPEHHGVMAGDLDSMLAVAIRPRTGKDRNANRIIARRPRVGRA